MATSRRYAEEVSNRIDRVIRSIRSNSPVLRSSAIYESPIHAVSEIHRLDHHNVVLDSHNRALNTHNVVLDSHNRALNTHNVVLDNHNRVLSGDNRVLDTHNRVLDANNRALLAENHVLRDQSVIHTDLIVENSHIRSDLKKSFVENELLRQENKAIPAYKSQVNSLVRQTADISAELNHQTREASTWKVRFDEADHSAANYRALYQQALQDNESLKIEVVELRKDLAHMGAVKLENSRLHAQNQDLLDQLARLNRDLAARNDENADLRARLREIDVLRGQLSLSEQENNRLRDTIANQNDIIVDLRKTISALHVEINNLKADLSIIPTLEAKIQAEIRNNEGLAARLRDRDATIVELNRTIVALNAEINNLKADLSIIPSLEAKLNGEIRNNEALAAKLREKDSIIVELNRTISALHVEINNLKADLSIIPSLENKINIEIRNNEALGEGLRQKDAIIADLNRTISALNLDIANLKRDVAQLNDAVAQNARFRAEIDRLLGEIDNLKHKLARLIEVESRLVVVSGERDHLGNELNHKLDIIRDQTHRIAHLEDQLAALEQLKAKVVLVVAENERLGQLVVEQSRTISEWADKYDQLERLYIAVKATTADLENVKNRFEHAVKASEVRNPNLRNSYYRAGKGELGLSRYSVGGSDTTMGSPADPYSPHRII